LPLPVNEVQLTTLKIKSITDVLTATNRREEYGGVPHMRDRLTSGSRGSVVEYASLLALSNLKSGICRFIAQVPDF
jgi:hypothetical protein